MTIVVTGGGSGGHITPILAVASSLKRLDPQLRVVYVGQKGDKLADIPAQDPHIDTVCTVRAGKFRRYYGEGWRQLFDVRTQALNVRDALRVVIGLVQSYLLMRQLRPAVIFSRGGFVSVPVCLGGKLAGIPYVTHDSDSVPSLANRLIARWARLHAVALPEEAYPYPAAKTRTVGIPLQGQYEPVTPAIQQRCKQELGLSPAAPVLLVTGGGNGADELNRTVAANAPYLLQRYPSLQILHIAGRGLETTVRELYDDVLAAGQRPQVHVLGFVTDFFKYSAAADVIVARGGATNLAEFAVQAKACVIIPAGQLVGGHQTKNARILAKDNAIIMLTQEQAAQERRLANVVSELLDDPEKRALLSRQIASLGRPQAADTIARLLLDMAAKGRSA